MDQWLINGDIADSIPADDRGLAYGDGLFETIAVRASQARFLGQHLSRLELSCKRLGLAYPGDTILSNEVHQLAAGRSHAVIKIIITRGIGPRGYAADPSESPQRLVGLSATQAHPAAYYVSGVSVVRCSTRVSRSPLLAGMKTLNRLEQVLARAEWRSPKIAEGLMFDEHENLISGVMSNVFLVVDGTLLTPGLSHSGIAGTMRQRVIDVWLEQGIRIAECPITPELFSEASELFLTNALIGLWPVTKIDDRQYSVGDFSRRTMGLLADAGVNECNASARSGA